MKKKDREIEQYIEDCIMGRPYGFSVKDRHFYLYPMTLGKTYLLRRQIEALAINEKNLETEVSLEALRLVKEKKAECLAVIAYHTCNGKEDVFNAELVAERVALFDSELTDEDIAALMIIVLTSDRTQQFIKYLGIDKEQDRASAIMKIKNRENNNSVTLGGLSQFGNLLDIACERYGWTKDYVVWGIDLSSLRLMLADKVSSMYLSDDEMKKVPRGLLSSNSAKIQADDPKNKDIIKSMKWR